METSEQTTTTPSPCPNKATIAGVLLPDLGGPKQSALGAPVTQIQIQVLTPFGEPFSLPVQLAGEAEQQFRLRRGQTRNLVVSGQVRLGVQHDTRFARPEDVMGERVQRMELVAQTVRPLSPEETVGASLVELEGTVVGQPVPRPHPHLPTQDCIEVTLACSVPHTVSLGGTALSRTLRYRVRLAVPRRVRNATYLYVPGNKVQVVGELDCVLVRWLPDGADGASAFQQAQAAWEEAQRRFARSPQRLSQERERYFRAIRRLELTLRWHVLVSQVLPGRGAIRVREALTSEGTERRQRRLQVRSKRGAQRDAQPLEEQAEAPIEDAVQPAEAPVLADSAEAEAVPQVRVEEPALDLGEVQAEV